MWPFNAPQTTTAAPATVPQSSPSDDTAKRRVYLKIKIKSLAAEASIIRREEKRWPGPSATRTGLHLHRVFEVRHEARAALLAYAFLRGRTYRAVEKSAHESPDWKRIETIAIKYADTQSLLKENFAAWRKAAES